MAQELNRKITNPDGTTSYVSGATPQDVNSAITTASLAPTPPIVIPQVKPDTTNYSGLVAGGNAIVGANTATLTPQTDTQNPSSLEALMASINTPAPSASATYNTDYANSGIDTAQTDVNAKAQVTKDAQARLAAINAQLAGITAEAQAIPIQTQQDATGRGITAAGLAPITTAQLRNNALKALPLQAQALATQAEVASAQNNEALSQSILQQAQSHLDTVFKIHMDDAQAQYTQKTNALNSIYSYLTAQEKTKADALQKANDQAFTTQQNALNQAQDLAKTAIANGQGNLAGQIMALDPNSKTYQTDVANLAGQIQPDQLRQLQIQKAQQDLAGGGSGLLSVSEAQALGVPYGTTKAQAVGAGIIPQKQATAAQETTALYANRIEQSNSIISKLDNAVATMNPIQYAAYQKTPQVLNFLKSSDFQSVDQAQRNFVNAVLRRESGAVISPQEFDNARQQYFVMPGDTPTTITQKKANRDLVQQGFVSGAGQAYTPLVQTDQYASFRSQLKGGEILVNRNGQATAIQPNELQASDVKL